MKFPIITVHWKESERDEHAEKLHAVRLKIARTPNARAMSMSCSATMAIYSTDQCLERLDMWRQWHEHWAHDTIPTANPPSAMPARVGIPPVLPKGNGARAYGCQKPPNQASSVDLFDLPDDAWCAEEAGSLTDSVSDDPGHPSSNGEDDSETASLSSMTGSLPDE